MQKLIFAYMAACMLIFNSILATTTMGWGILSDRSEPSLALALKHQNL